MNLTMMQMFPLIGRTKKAGTSRFRPLSRRLTDRCQYIRGQRSETNSIWLDAEVGAAKSRVAWGRGSSSPNRPS